jgi:hypothetical protein
VGEAEWVGEAEGVFETKRKIWQNVVGLFLFVAIFFFDPLSFLYLIYFIFPAPLSPPLPSEKNSMSPSIPVSH